MGYANNGDMLAAQKRIRERNRAYVVAFLKNHPCSHCGETDLRVLEFDHVAPATKKFNVGRMVSSQHHSIASIQKEIDKCQVLCANCHRKKTHAERGISWATF
jgi:5-methylcytosine-specific restriction endonuclease McrA